MGNKTRKHSHLFIVKIIEHLKIHRIDWRFINSQIILNSDNNKQKVYQTKNEPYDNAIKLKVAAYVFMVMWNIVSSEPP